MTWTDAARAAALEARRRKATSLVSGLGGVGLGSRSRYAALLAQARAKLRGQGVAGRKRAEQARWEAKVGIRREWEKTAEGKAEMAKQARARARAAKRGPKDPGARRYGY